MLSMAIHEGRWLDVHAARHAPNNKVKIVFQITKEDSNKDNRAAQLGGVLYCDVQVAGYGI